MLRVIFPALLIGCTPVCPGPSQVDGAWSSFANVLSRQGGDDQAFPAASSPTNGRSQWAMAWGDLLLGPVSLAFDGQPVQATGVWSTSSCGRFTLQIDGLYTRDGAEHAFEADGSFVVYDDALAGTWDWSETWQAQGGQTGIMTARAQIDAVRDGGS